MTTIEQSIEIAAPPNEVFVFFVPQRMSYWYGTEMDCQLEVSGGEADFRVAQKVRVSGHFKGKISKKKEIAHTVVVTRYEAPQLLEWRFEDSYGVRGLERWKLEPTASGTRVTMRSEYEMPGHFGRIVDWIITRHAVARRNCDYLVRLRKLAARG